MNSPGIIGLNALEQAVLEKLLAGDHPKLRTLREQCRHARLESRELTGVGFYCNFEVDDNAPTVVGHLELGGVLATFEGDFGHASRQVGRVITRAERAFEHV